MLARRKLRWELVVSVVTAVSVGIIVLDYSYDFAPNEKLTVYIFDTSVVALLIIDFRKRMKESNEGYKYLLKHWYELPAMLPIFVFDSFEQYVSIGIFLRGLRLVRLFRLVQLLSRTARIFAETRYIYIVVLSGSAIILGGLAMYVAESDNQQANIRTMEDGFWWAIVTVTTVGYGDKYPVTTVGRIIASVVMLIGIAVLGILISTLGASFIESRIKKSSSRASNGVRNSIKGKIDNLENLRKEDLSILLSDITSLYESLNETSHRLPLCTNCNYSCPEKSLFCNICGATLSGN